MTNTKHTKEVYDKFAQEYHDFFIDKNNIWHAYIEKPIMIQILKNEIKNKIVLDLGCGSGPFVKELYSLGAKKVYGLDLSPELIKIAKKENPSVDFVSGDAKKTNYKSYQFDIVSSSLMVHYFKSPGPLFAEVNRIIKKGGLFVFSMHHPVMEITHRLKLDEKTNITQFENYFHNNIYNWKLKDNMEMIVYYHTFELIFMDLNKNGFIVENLFEPLAPKII
ncbi:hypothetical protein COU57_01315 [Candidatus Pacearchaeota archaeon CG10_big_fil_rev_8_21_14_0_10_32_14]|nr:MAG: hypothetical protein COU57_01315 [Candidatus Pacearchaeota archaeon CG10_big_fil_rev_8_21_14_0_10_32_14]